jgi:hypothetical protein
LIQDQVVTVTPQLDAPCEAAMAGEGSLVASVGNVPSAARCKKRGTLIDQTPQLDTAQTAQNAHIAVKKRR